WTDVADECERFLGKKQFCGVQVSPPNEHVVVTHPMRPWWERYQPVSYKLHSRGGTEAEFKDMVTRCKNVGVRIYVDSVINHMAGLGRTGQGSGGTSFNSDNYDFPGVPYRREHFNSRNKCPSHDGNINNYGDPNNVRNCFLVGLTDLDQSQEYVRNKIAEFYNHCIDLGVAGFRIDAAKHMWPGDIKAIQDRTKDLPEGGRPFFYHEVIDLNDGAIKVSEYTGLGYVTEFRYCPKIAEGIRNFGMLHTVYDPGWGMTDSSHAFVFVDNYDNQRRGDRNIITHKSPRDYKMAVAFTLAYNYGFTRVMSSYYFQSSDEGPPHNSDYSAKDVTINADGSCGNGWVCEHRWNPIANMAVFRNAVAGTEIKNWRNQNDEISFARGQKGFFAMAKQGHMDTILQTGLPTGEYCDLVSDCKKKITVDGSGTAHVIIDNSAEPMVAFIVDGPTAPGDNFLTLYPLATTLPPVSITLHIVFSTRGSIVSPTTGSIGLSTTSSPRSTFTPGNGTWSRTVILFEKMTRNGEDLFIDGGISHDHRQGCTTTAATSVCAIPIKYNEEPSFYKSFNAWKQGDNYLDWYGPEVGQGTYLGRRPTGSPTVWTTNDRNSQYYSPLNTYGPHYWLLDVMMDCSSSENGWFEFKYKIYGHWEGAVHNQHCGDPSYLSDNHMAKCGAKNVFHQNGQCEIRLIDYQPPNQTSIQVPISTTREQRTTNQGEITTSSNQMTTSAATAKQASCDNCENLLTSQCANNFQPCSGVCMLQSQANIIQSKCIRESECKYKQTLGLLFPGRSTICCNTDDCFQKELFHILQGYIATNTRSTKVLVTIKN
ncbi:alpha-amylase-like, partial [Saccostrea cucullata]|uniref:alpha-amylase-like n=1 Tax=Saccostrea cuccullata TaxID=36930 RepID=UPI002ED079D8